MPGQAKILTPSAEKRVFDYIALERPRTFKQDRVKLLLSLRAGMRACEIVGLTFADITDAEGNLSDEIRVRKETSKGGKKTFTRYIPMHPELKVALQDVMPSIAKPSLRVVLNRSREPLSANGLAVWFRDLYTKAGLDGCSSHSGRRSLLTNLARNCTQHGASLKDVQAISGHAEISSLALYVDPNRGAKHALIRSV
ncbi:MAG: site-specific integrase [Pseudomonadota bacterium]